MFSPVHMQSRGRYGNNFWEVYSPKLKRDVHLYSDLEYDHWLLVESNPNIETFCEQPLRISYTINGIRRDSIFDMWIRLRDGSTRFIEVKYSKDLNPQNPSSREALEQTQFQRAWCAANGYEYSIQTEEHIWKNPIHLANMKKVIGYIKNRPHPIETDQYKITHFLSPQPVTISKLLESTPDITPSRLRESICWLIFQGKLHSNLDQELFGPKTEVWLND